MSTQLKNIDVPQPMSQKILVVLILGLLIFQTVIFNKMVYTLAVKVDTYIFTHKNDPNRSHKELKILESRVDTLEKEIATLRTK